MAKSLEEKRFKHGKMIEGFPEVRAYHFRTDLGAEKEWKGFEEKYGQELAELRKEREKQEYEFDKKHGDFVFTY